MIQFNAAKNVSIAREKSSQRLREHISMASLSKNNEHNVIDIYRAILNSLETVLRSNLFSKNPQPTYIIQHYDKPLYQYFQFHNLFTHATDNHNSHSIPLTTCHFFFFPKEKLPGNKQQDRVLHTASYANHLVLGRAKRHNLKTGHPRADCCVAAAEFIKQTIRHKSRA